MCIHNRSCTEGAWPIDRLLIGHAPKVHDLLIEQKVYLLVFEEKFNIHDIKI